MQHDAIANRAFVVEDDPLFADQIRAALQRLDPLADVLVCPTGDAALTRLDLQRQPPRVALVDIGLPDISGIEVIAALRSRFESLPILVISVLTSERSVVEAIRAGANGYVLKDMTVAALAHAIAEVIDGNYPLSPSLARSLFRLVAAQPEPPAPSGLTLSDRETETLRCIARGLSYEQTARQMNISLSTVQTHVRNLYRKLNVRSQTQAAAAARTHGLI